MRTIEGYFRRYANALAEFVRFGLVGGLGVLVNMVVFVGISVLCREVFGIRNQTVIFPIPGTPWNFRFLLFYSLVAFLVANLFNFIINRNWTFRAGPGKAPFLKEYGPFLTVGLAAEVIGWVILVLLTNPKSPVALPSDIFDNSSGLRTKSYWANLIKVVLVTPVNFVLNKLWTFRLVRRAHVDARRGDNAADVS